MGKKRIANGTEGRRGLRIVLDVGIGGCVGVVGQVLSGVIRISVPRAMKLVESRRRGFGRLQCDRLRLPHIKCGANPGWVWQSGALRYPNVSHCLHLLEELAVR